MTVDDLRLTIPASSGNLGPGFDCLGLALGLHNHFTYTSDDEYSISFSGKLPLDAKFAEPQNNLVVKSYEYACESIGQAPQPFALDIEINIPTAAGMGSSGTAILAGCAKALIDKSFAGQADLPNKLPDEVSQELLQIASNLEGHPDNVAPSIYGGFVVSIAMDESSNSKNKRYKSTKIAVDDSIQCLIIKPQVETITAESRLTLSADIAREDAVFNIGHAALVATAFATKDYKLLIEAVADKIHEKQRDTSYNYFGLKNKLLDEGAIAVALSGSGPSVLVLVNKETIDKSKKLAAEHFQQIGLGHECFLVPVDNSGILINSKE